MRLYFLSAMFYKTYRDDIIVCKSAGRESENMKVRYDSGLWDRGMGIGGYPQRVNWEFDYAGATRIIPVIYRFSKGIVFDILTPLDENKLREYYGQYGDDDTKLSDEERSQAERDNPYQDISIKEIRINKKPVIEGYSSSCALIVPWNEDKSLSPIRRAYRRYMKDTSCFACQRYCVPYPGDNSAISKLKKFLRLERIRNIEFATFPAYKFFPLDMRFEITGQDFQKELKFRHPVAGTVHTLYFQSPEEIEVPLDGTGARRFYVTQLLYETYPPLPDGDSLEFDSSTQYTAIPSADGLIMPESVSSIGIIGGADGPTAIFAGTGANCGVLLGAHGLPLKRCFSVPKLSGDRPAYFILQGINVKKYESAEYSLGEQN